MHRGEKMDINLLISEFLNHMEKTLRRSSNTIRAYGNDLKKFGTFLKSKGYDLAKIDTIVLQEFAAELALQGLSSSTIHRIIYTTRGFITFLEDRKIIAHNVSRPQLPRLERKLPEFLTFEEISRILNLPRNSSREIRDLAIVACLYYGGLRVSELCNLQMDDVWFGNPAHIRVRMGKGMKDRIVPLNEDARLKMHDYMRIRREFVRVHTSFFFLSVRGKPLDASSVYRIVQNTARRAGINRRIHPHVFRHSFATHLLQRGVNVRIVQDLLGHASMSTTSKYLHVGDTEKLSAVQLLSLV